jgi:hypothetical protein
MTESITFNWHDEAGEARPSPTTRKKLDEWKTGRKGPPKGRVRNLCIIWIS